MAESNRATTFEQSLGRMQLVGFKPQVIPPTLASLQGVEFLKATFTETADRIERADKRRTLTFYERFAGKRSGTFSIDAYLRPSGVLGTPSDISGLMVAAGLTEAIVPGVSVIYSLGGQLAPLIFVSDLEAYGEYVFDAHVGKITWSWDGGDACKIGYEGIFSHKNVAGTTTCIGDQLVGDATIEVVDASLFEVNSFVRAGTNSGAAFGGYRVTAVDETLNTITISPAIEVATVPAGTEIGPDIPIGVLSVGGVMIDGNSGVVGVGTEAYSTVSGKVTCETTLEHTGDEFGLPFFGSVFALRRRVTLEFTLRATKAALLPILESRRGTQKGILIDLGMTPGSSVRLAMNKVEFNPVEAIEIPDEAAIQATISGIALGTSDNDELVVAYL